MDISEMKRRIIEKIKKDNIDISALDSFPSKSDSQQTPVQEEQAQAGVRQEPPVEPQAPEMPAVPDVGEPVKDEGAPKGGVRVGSDLGSIEDEKPLEGNEYVPPPQVSEDMVIDPEKILKEKYRQIFGDDLKKERVEPVKPVESVPADVEEPPEEQIEVVAEPENDKILQDRIAQLTSEIEERDRRIEEMERQYQGTISDELKAVKEQAASDIEDLKSKLYVVEMEARERAGRMAELEDSLRTKNDQLLQAKTMEVEKAEIASRLQAAEKERDEFALRMTQLNRTIEDLDRRLSTELASQEKGFEAERGELILKAEALDREYKDLEGKINQLNLELSAKNKRLEDTEKLYKGLDDLIKDAAVKVQTTAMEKRALDEKLSQTTAELAIKSKKLIELEKYYKNIETNRNELELKLQSTEKERAELSAKVSQFNLELEAKTRRLEETEKLSKELDQLVKDISLRLQSAERDKKEFADRVVQLSARLESEARKRESERLIVEENLSRFKAEIDTLKKTVDEKQRSEAELKQAVSYLQSEIEARDKKIEADIKYYEKLVREISELRQKTKK